MPLTELNHYFVRCRDLEQSRSFYCDALGFQIMPRPDFPFPGYWLGVGGKVQVHMGLDGVPGEATHYFGTTPRSARDNAGVVDHIAFQGNDPEGFARQLKARGLVTRTRYIGEIHLFQIFVTDPDGLVIELNFPGVTEAPTWAATGKAQPSVEANPTAGPPRPALAPPHLDEQVTPGRSTVDCLAPVTGYAHQKEKANASAQTARPGRSDLSADSNGAVARRSGERLHRR